MKMKNKNKLDKIFTLMTIGMVIAFVGDIFFDYDLYTYFFSMIMFFCWDISMTLRRLSKATLGDEDR